MKPIEHYLLLYAKWMIAHHPGPRWVLRDYLHACLTRWREVYGDQVADQVHAQIKGEWGRKG